MKSTSACLLMALLAVSHVRAADWVSPTGFADPEGKWSNETKAYDDNTGTYATDSSVRCGWGAWIELSYSNAVHSSRVRVNADWWTAAADGVDIDVFKDGAWADVWQGAITDCAWTEKEFPAGNVTKIRFRYHYISNNYIFWLYEADLLAEPLPATAATVETLPPTAVESATALLHGRIAGDGGVACEYRFRYGPTTAYGQATPWKSGGVAGTRFTERLTNLTENAVYHVQAQVRNTAGEVGGPDVILVACPPAVGWLPATGWTDPDGKWDDEARGSNDDTGDCARSFHPIGGATWGSFVYLTRPAIACDGLRLMARQGGYVDQIDVDVYKNGVWVDLYQGTYTDKQWLELNFAAGSVTQARIRFHVTDANCGLYWELYDFAFRYAPPAGDGPAAILSRCVPARATPGEPRQPEPLAALQGRKEVRHG